MATRNQNNRKAGPIWSWCPTWTPPSTGANMTFTEHLCYRDYMVDYLGRLNQRDHNKIHLLRKLGMKNSYHSKLEKLVKWEWVKTPTSIWLWLTAKNHYDSSVNHWPQKTTTKKSTSKNSFKRNVFAALSEDPKAKHSAEHRPRPNSGKPGSFCKKKVA